MKILNHKLSAIAAGVILASAPSYAEIELGKGLSVSGFVDMSFYYEDDDSMSSTTRNFAIDQVETQFMYKFDDTISAQVDIEYSENNEDDFDGGTTNADGESTFVEQAFITKAFNDQFSVTAGRFLSYSGWETEEPTGLFQYSGVGYAGVFYGGYQQGVSGKYAFGDALAITLSVVNDVYAATQADTTNLGTELGFHVTPAEGITAKAFYLMEGDNTSINLWASLATGPMTFAVEYNTREHDDFDFDTATATDGTDFEGDGYLFMANYAAGAYGITARYGAWELEQDGATFSEVSNITIAPSYAVSDNLLLVAEYKMETDDTSDNDTDSFALEALLTF